MNPTPKKSSVIIICLHLFICIGCSNKVSSKYYVSNSGNDNNDGITPKTAWKSLSKVNSKHFQPGDSIFFERNSVWREMLKPSSNGAPEKYIFYGSYGNGKNPRFLGSNKPTGWIMVSENIWKSSSNGFQNPRSLNNKYSNIWFELAEKDTVVWGIFKNNSTSDITLNNEFEWTYKQGEIYIYSNSDPSKIYKSIEVSQRHNCIEINNKNFVEINGIDLHYSAVSGIRDTYPTTKKEGLIIRNCRISHIGVKNSPAAFGIYIWTSNTLIENNEIHDCGRRGISYFGTNKGEKVEFGKLIVQDNTFYNGWHTTALDIIIQRRSEHSIDSVIFRRNLIKENKHIKRNGKTIPNSNHVFIADQSAVPGSYIKNVYIYCNIFEYAPGSAVKTENIKNLNVCNNTFYKFNPYLNNFQSFVNITGTIEAEATSIIKNNIFYHNGIFRQNNNLQCIKINPELKNLTEIDYNLYYTEDFKSRIFTSFSPRQSYVRSNWITYKRDWNYDLNSPVPSKPNFKNAENGNYELNPSSSAIDSGVKISWIKKDYKNQILKGLPDIGAIQME